MLSMLAFIPSKTKCLCPGHSPLEQLSSAKRNNYAPKINATQKKKPSIRKGPSKRTKRVLGSSDHTIRKNRELKKDPCSCFQIL